MKHICTLLIAMATMVSCQSEKELADLPPLYEGPISTLYSARILHSDSTIITAKINADTLYEFQSGDRELPGGVFMEFLNNEGIVTSTLKANYAYYQKKEDVWRGEGDVVVHNIEKDQTLRTEELYWEPKSQDVYTEKRVRIIEGDEIWTGLGLRSKQDFSEYEILHPEGEFNIEGE